MEHLNIPQPRISRLTHQPNFPHEDLTTDNAEMMKYLLVTDSGLDSYAEMLAPKQRYVYEIARKAILSLNIDSPPGPKQLAAFSHGFAGMEIMTDIVHERPTYPNELAAAKVADIFIDTRSLDDIQIERELLNDASKLPDDILEDGLLPRYLQTSTDSYAELPPETLSLFITRKRHEGKPVGHDKPNPERKLATQHGEFQAKNPNTADVIISLGEKRQEAMPELHMRLAGAALARSLQVTS